MAAGWTDLDGEDRELAIVLPSQYHDTSAVWTPEQELQAACLVDAVRCYRRHDPQAERWFFHDAPAAYPFNFHTICESLRLSVAQFRRRLIRDRNRRK
jgi:hypothetical protein